MAKNGNLNTSLTLETMDKNQLGNTRYARIVREELVQLKKSKLNSLPVDAVRNLENKLVKAQVGFFLEHDNAGAYYNNIFKNLGLTPGSDFDPHRLLPSICYSVGNLVGDNFKHMAIKGLSGGRVFESSGTTDPQRRKKIYYDELSCLFIREILTYQWEQATRATIAKKDRSLMLAPPEAVFGMPFAAFATDIFAARGAQVFFGTKFISPPAIAEDADFRVRTAKINFKNNVLPAQLQIARYNAEAKLHGGCHTVMGLLPAVMALIISTGNFKGIKSFFAKIKPDVILYGGGLKKQGIPPAIQAQGTEAVKNFLKNISDITGFDLEFLISLHLSPEEIDKSKLDDVLVLYYNFLINKLGAQACNVYAAADMQPSMFSVGSLLEIYGENYYRAGSGQQINKDIYYYMPGHIVELLDPVTGDIIPRSKLQVPGILAVWNPYTVSHLQVPQTEDLLQWVKIPATAPFNPPYMEGIGLQFVGRLKNAKGVGIC